MKTTIWAAVLTVLGAGAAFAQEGDLRREFEKRLRELEERFGVERQKLEKEFREKREKFMPRREEGERPRLEELVERLTQRVEQLERRLGDKFGDFGRALPKDFDFKRLRELMPRFEDRDFRFEFRRKADDEEKKPEKKKAEKKSEEKKKPKEGDNF
ncbi:MAG TPA: hypothetical protein VF950_23875 [Planctomycetota bacterium]